MTSMTTLRRTGLALSLLLSLAAGCRRDRAEEAPVAKDPASHPPGTDNERKGLRDSARGGGEYGASVSAPGGPGALFDAGVPDAPLPAAPRP